MPTEKIIDLEDVDLVHKTAGALRVRYDGTFAWVPRSQVEYDEVDRVLTLPEWLAIDKELV